MQYLTIAWAFFCLSQCDSFGGWRPVVNGITNAPFQLRTSSPSSSSSSSSSSTLFSSFDDDMDDRKKESPTLGIDIGAQLQPLSPEDIEQLREEATEKINEAFAGRIKDLENLKEDIRKDFERSKVELRFESDRRTREETEKLMNKIDKISADFLDKNEALRSGTKLAARADKSMAGKGLDIGSWGKIGGTNVLTSSSSRTVVGVLGSVDSSIKNTKLQTDETVDETIVENRILIICDDNQDKNSAQVLKRFQQIFNQKFPAKVTFETLSPTSNIPMGGDNSKCVVISSASLSGRSTAESILGRLLKRTIAPGGGKISKPPTQFVILSPAGTERIEAFPYSMQNMMGGGKLKKAREVEEVTIATVKGRFIADSSTPALDYTIVKLGQVVEDDKISNQDERSLTVRPGDCLDGRVGVSAAANALVQAVIMRPTARNTTISVSGAIAEGDIIDDDTWEDLFIRMEGPELWRSSELNAETDDFEQGFESLSAYLKEWSTRFENGAKGTGLTTPVTVSLSTFQGDVATSIVRKKFGLMLQFKQTNTGANYKSKSEEKMLERQSVSDKPITPVVKVSKQKKEGGVEIVVEEVAIGAKSHYLRVRARRCNMDDNTVIKEMSEETIVKSLGDALNVWMKR